MKPVWVFLLLVSCALALSTPALSQQSPQVSALATLRPYSLPDASDPQNIAVKCGALVDIGSINPADFAVAAEDTLALLPKAARVCEDMYLSRIGDKALADSLARTIKVAVLSVAMFGIRMDSAHQAMQIAQYNQLVNNYNQLLTAYQTELARNNRRSNALAAYQAWQAAHPAPQTIQMSVCTNPFGCPK